MIVAHKQSCAKKGGPDSGSTTGFVGSQADNQGGPHGENLAEVLREKCSRRNFI
jgi:hypothetical protein